MTMLMGVALLAPAALAQLGPSIPPPAGSADIEPEGAKAGPDKPAAKKPARTVQRKRGASKTAAGHKTAAHKGAGAHKTPHKAVAKHKAPAHKTPAKHVGLGEALLV
jgi:hypothetical protein